MKIITFFTNVVLLLEHNGNLKCRLFVYYFFFFLMQWTTYANSIDRDNYKVYELETQLHFFYFTIARLLY